MKLLKGIVLTEILAEPAELMEARAILSMVGEDDEVLQFVNEDNKFFTGLIDYLVKGLNGRFEITIEDTTEAEQPQLDAIQVPLDLLPNKPLRDYQQSIVRKAIYHQRGIIEIATGGGKTLVGAGIFKYLSDNDRIQGPALYIVSTDPLLEQAYQDFAEYGLTGAGRYGSGHREIDRRIIIATAASLWSAIKKRDAEVLDKMTRASAVIFDEVHHLASFSWTNIGAIIGAPYRYGLSATAWEHPLEFNPRDLFLIGLTGPLIARLPARYLIDRGYLAEPIISMVTVSREPVFSFEWLPVYSQGVVNNRYLNSFAADLAVSLYRRDMRTLILVQQHQQGWNIVEELLKRGMQDFIFTMGGRETTVYENSNRREERWDIHEIRRHIERNPATLVIASPVFAEGVNIPTINALILACGYKKHRMIMQRLGRVMRPKEGDNVTYIFDFNMTNHPWLRRHSEQRVEFYRLEGYQVHQGLKNAEQRLGFVFGFQCAEGGHYG